VGHKKRALSKDNTLNILIKNGGDGGSRTYSGPYSHKGLQRFTECLLNVQGIITETSLAGRT